MTRSAADIRSDFLKFFGQRGHTLWPASPVVPYEDPTLLFTNAGMNQFKPLFLGQADPRSEFGRLQRVANSQPCIRAGGKHNDLDDVGHDTYHHTLFEMLGNWSFGDYFKREAIRWAWELLTQVWGLDKRRLHATYFGGSKGAREQGIKGSRDQGIKGGAGVSPTPAAGRRPALPDAQTGGDLEPDFESRDLWTEVTDIDPSHVHPGSMKDNFWEMGETGPCGPCSEIHIDLTPDFSGGPLVNAGDPRVIELWNLVFIQFNRGPDGKLSPLPSKHVDTGMGLERVAAVIQGHNNNYATDLFVPILAAIERLSGHRYGAGSQKSEVRSQKPEVRTPRTADATPSSASDFFIQTSDLSRYAAFRPDSMQDVACRVIADHIRALVFAICDGCLPDREGRGYVLRRILRRAVRYGWQYLGLHEPFLCELVPTVVETLGPAFPRLTGRAGLRPGAGAGEPPALPGHAAPPALDPVRVAEVIREEEESFERTLERGIALFEEAADTARRYHAHEICGEDAFKLHDTYGFPIDLTEIMARERGLTVDTGEYERLMEEARERARAWGRVADFQFSVPPGLLRRHAATDSTAKYETCQAMGGVQGFIRLELDPPGMYFEDQEHVPWTHSPGTQGALFLDTTCFYAESGGQVGDRGTILFSGSKGSFEVQDTQLVGNTVLHFGRFLAHTTWRVGDAAELRVDVARRIPTMQNHTATHVMNWALREVLGEHVQQKGSLVDPDKTRFDLSHPRAVTLDELERIESLVNQKIEANLPVYAEVEDQQQALKINGLRAVFGEKYPDRVRVVSIGVPVEKLVADPENPEWRKYSIEFCGGTHVKSTREIERFVLTSEEAVAKGIRRVVGITGERAREAEARGRELLERAESLRRAVKGGTGIPPVAGGKGDTGASGVLGGTGGTGVAPVAARGPDDVAAQVAELQRELAEGTIPVVVRAKLRDAIADLQADLKERQKVAAVASADVVNARIDELLASATRLGPTTVIVAEMPDVPVEQLKSGADRIKQKCRSAAVLFGVWVGRASSPPSEKGSAGLSPAVRQPAAAELHAQPGAAVPHAGKALLLAAVTDDLVKRGIRAGDWVKAIAPIVDGGGGGPPTMAQAGGKNPARLAEALDAGRQWIESRLGSDA